MGVTAGGFDEPGIRERSIGERLGEVRSRIESAARRAGRDSAEVTLVAVSKTFPAEVVRAVFEAGANDLGENRAQELKQKVAVLGAGPRWHFVGHLQSNKVRQVVGAAHLIHSVDRYGLAEAIGRRAVSLGIVQDVLIEVNVSGEGTKNGIEPARTTHLAAEISELSGVKLKGLMTMAPLHPDPEASRPYLAELRTLRDDLLASVPSATELSMGMTNDFEVAIEEGATLVRVGQAIFGPRSAVPG